ncbi:MAG TPA: VanW family protein [bacterium]|nr:VanW family protein [bacterium]
MSPNKPTIKLKRARFLLDEMHSAARGWLKRFVPPDRRAPDTAGWSVIADYPTPIRQRPELGDVNQQRIANMRLCCTMLDGLLLRPGDILSMQHIVGEATAARGFKMGPIIVGGHLQSAVGGGLCQISTALFNVALLANFTILQKYPHSTDIWGEQRLVPLGRDAAYVYARRDIKFASNHTADAALHLRVNDAGTELAAQLRSPVPLPVTVHIASTIMAELPSAVKNGRPGWKVQTVRTATTPSGEGTITWSRVETYQPEHAK